MNVLLGWVIGLAIGMLMGRDMAKNGYLDNED